MKLSFKNWLDETTLVGGGHITGDTPSPDDILYYQNCNMQDADTRDNQLMSNMKSMHTDLHSNPDDANKEASKILSGKSTGKK
jgi:hypothetical protein